MKSNLAQAAKAAVSLTALIALSVHAADTTAPVLPEVKDHDKMALVGEDVAKPEPTFNEIAKSAGFKVPKGSTIAFAQFEDLNSDGKRDFIVAQHPSKNGFTGAVNFSIYLNRGTNEKPRLEMVFSNARLLKIQKEGAGQPELNLLPSIADGQLQLTGSPGDVSVQTAKTYTLQWSKATQQFEVQSYLETQSSCSDEAAEKTSAQDTTACQEKRTAFDFKKRTYEKTGTTECKSSTTKMPTLEMLAAGQDILAPVKCK